MGEALLFLRCLEAQKTSPGIHPDEQGPTDVSPVEGQTLAIVDTEFRLPRHTLVPACCVLPALKCEVGSCCVAQADLKLLGSSNPSASASLSAGMIGVSHRIQPREVGGGVDKEEREEPANTGSHHIGQASLELLGSGIPSASASQSARITGVSHHAWSQNMSLCHPWVLAVFDLLNADDTITLFHDKRYRSEGTPGDSRCHLEYGTEICI
ncbi:hypothetical protein AAY473_011383 [Plecturocebus cupreus]